MFVIRIAIALILLAISGWNGYVLATGGAARDIANIALVAVPGLIGLLMIAKDILKTIVGNIKISKPSNQDPSNTETLEKLLNKYMNKDKTETKPADAAAPEEPITSLRDIENQQVILNAINTLYAYFVDDPSSTALVANVAKAFMAKCYPIEQKK